MPCFFFDLSDGYSTVTDEQGVNCASLDDAEQEALKMLPLMVAQHRRGRDTLATIVIRDVHGTPKVEVVLTLSARRLEPAWQS